MQKKGNRNTLLIRKVEMEDFGNYSCSASNMLGKARAYVRVQGESRHISSAKTLFLCHVRNQLIMPPPVQRGWDVDQPKKGQFVLIGDGNRAVFSHDGWGLSRRIFFSQASFLCWVMLIPWSLDWRWEKGPPPIIRSSFRVPKRDLLLTSQLAITKWKQWENITTDTIYYCASQLMHV